MPVVMPAVMNGQKEKVAVVGARGYAGLELLRLLGRHPHAEIKGAFATEAFLASDYIESEIKGEPTEKLWERVTEMHTVFLATPIEVSRELAPRILAAGANVIDLSGAFRLEGGACGLSPWARAPVQKPALIANPGCFATAATLALTPLVRLIDLKSVVIDAKSGTTGAGRKAEERLLHAEVDGICLPYRIGRHQHEPEIQKMVRDLTGARLDFHFTTHLLPVRRGILASVYARLNKGVEEAHVAKAFEEAFGNDPLLRVKSLNEAGGEALLNLRRVVGTCRAHVVYHVQGEKIFVFALIDNLLKGAASQAIENFNRLIEVPHWLGLTEMEGAI